MTRANRPTSEAQALVEQARAAHALSCLLQLLIAARQQTDIATWQRVGGLEAEDFLDALHTGRLHPLLQLYERRKASGGRAAPGLRERHFRRLAVLLSTALQRVPIDRHRPRKMIDKHEARKKTAKALAGLISITSYRSIERWELELEPPLGDEDERVIAAALQRCSPNADALIRHFKGFVHFPYAGGDSREGGSLIGNRNMPETSR
jgi:hypothetical protein